VAFVFWCSPSREWAILAHQSGQAVSDLFLACTGRDKKTSKIMNPKVAFSKHLAVTDFISQKPTK